MFVVTLHSTWTTCQTEHIFEIKLEKLTKCNLERLGHKTQFDHGKFGICKLAQSKSKIQ